MSLAVSTAGHRPVPPRMRADRTRHRGKRRRSHRHPRIGSSTRCARIAHARRVIAAIRASITSRSAGRRSAASVAKSLHDLWTRAATRIDVARVAAARFHRTRPASEAPAVHRHFDLCSYAMPAEAAQPNRIRDGASDPACSAPAGGSACDEAAPGRPAHGRRVSRDFSPSIARSDASRCVIESRRTLPACRPECMILPRQSSWTAMVER